MNRNTVFGWILLLALFMVWTRYKGEQAKEAQEARQAQIADSLAKVHEDSLALAAKTAPATSKASAARAGSTDGSEARLGPGDAPAGDSLAVTDSLPSEPAIEPQLIRVITPHFTAWLDNRGGRIARLDIPDLEGKEVANHTLIKEGSGGALTLSFDGHETGDELWEASTSDTLIDARQGRAEVSFTTQLPGGKPVTRTYAFNPESQAIDHTLRTDAKIGRYALDWEGGLEETERFLTGQGFGLTAGFFSEVVFDNGSVVARETFDGEKTFNQESGVLRWAGLRRKYISVMLDFDRDIPDRLWARGYHRENESSDWPKHYELRIAGEAFEGKNLDFEFRVQPLNYTEAKAEGKRFEKIIFSGWEWFMKADVWYVALCGFVLKVLNFFYGLIPNYGVAIILLTLLVRTVTFPLTLSQTKSAARMAEHQPEIRKIQEKFKGDRQKMQLEIMDYYRRTGINPMAPVLGCFPVLLQMPIFIALFNVLGRAVELREEGFFGWIVDLSYPDVVWSALKIPYVFPEGLTILPFFMAGTMWIQMKMTIKDPNQKFMVWMMPLMMFFFSCSFPSGLVLYWTVSNVFTIGQTAWINSKKKVTAGPTGAEPVEASFRPAKPHKDSRKDSGKAGSARKKG